MKLNPFENKRVFRDRVGNARTVVRDTYVNQTARISPKQEEPKKEEPKKEEPKKEEVKPTPKKRTTRKRKKQ